MGRTIDFGRSRFFTLTFVDEFHNRLPKIDKRNFGITKLEPWRFMERVVWTENPCCKGSFAFRLNVVLTLLL
jgi:hypothetical protein